MADLIDRQAAIQPEKRTEERTKTHACDCISRQAALDMHFFGGINEDGLLYVPFREVMEHLKGLPSAQPEIIRCKDCKYWGNKYWGKRGLCDKWDYYISNSDFYCGCAERRTDEQTD